MGKISRQSGLSLMGLIVTSVVIAVLALLVIKLAPEYVDYYQILSSVKAVARDANANPYSTVSDVKTSFRKRMEIDGITEFSAADLDISKNHANQVEIEFAYQRVIPLFFNVSLLIDFRGSSSD